MKIQTKALIILLIISSLFIKPSFAQDRHKVDSLLGKIKTAKHDTDKIKLLLNVGDMYQNNIPDTAKYYYNMALLKANKANNKKFIASSYKSIGIVFYNQTKYDNAMKYYLKSLKIYEELGDKQGIAGYYNLVGIIYRQQGTYNKALEYYFKSLKNREEINDKNGIASCFNNIGNVYYAQNSYDKALTYYQKSLKVAEEIKNKLLISKSFINIGNIYQIFNNYDKALAYYLKSLKIAKEICDKNIEDRCYINIGEIYNKQQEYDKALIFFLKSIKISKEIGENNLISLCYMYIGGIHQNKGRNDLANEYFIKSLKIEEELGDKNGKSMVLNYIANLKIKLKRYNETIDFAFKGLNLAKETGVLEIQRDNYKYLSAAYDSLHIYKQSLEYYKLFKQINDSIFNIESSKNLNELITNFETEKKQIEIEKNISELEKQASKISEMNYKVYVLVLSVLLTLVIAFFVIRKNKIKSLFKNIQMEQKLLQSQMNPHFIFNSLAVIQSIIYKNQNDIAVKYLSCFAKLTRMILEHSRVEYVSLDKEITMLGLYLDLQSIRFEDKFNYTIETDQELLPDMIAIPPMLAQPFIENAIEHGIIHKETTGNIKISFKTEGDFLLFEVSDDGVGRARAKEIKDAHANNENKHVSLATIITQERLANINKTLKRNKKIELKIIDLTDEAGVGCGTKVRFCIPLKTI